MPEEDKMRTAFEFDGRIYEWSTMVMGFKDAPQMMQRVMSKCCDSVLREGFNVYMVNVIVMGKSREEHGRRLKKVLQLFRQNNLKINREKIQFA